MPNEKVAGLPDHLAPLLEPTPSGVAKLVAAWDGLNTESQILILTELAKERLPAYLNETIRIKALDSANTYVRYLAARGLYFSGDDSEEKKSIRQRIEEDPDPLVRYSLSESQWSFLDRDLKQTDAFFALPHEARLARVRSLKSSGEAMANLIARAVDHHLKEGKVSEIELFEILSDYVNKQSFREYYNPNRELSYDGLDEFVVGKDIEALWELVLKLPEGLSHVLIEHLPPGVGLSPGIPEKVLKEMTPGQLETLLYRRDVGLEEFRKEIFRQPAERLDRLRCAAIANNFDLDYVEFAVILSKPQQEKTALLRDLASFAHDLSLVLHDAIHDTLFTIQEYGLDAPWHDAEYASVALEKRLKQLKDWRREKEMRELRLYRLAKNAVPWKKGEKGYPPSGELEFLSKLVVGGDTWGTFMVFSEVWAKNSWRTKRLEKHLPRIDEAGEDELAYNIQAGDEDAEESTDLMDRIKEKLTETVSRLADDAEGKQMDLKNSLTKLSADIMHLQEVKDFQTREAEEAQTGLVESLGKLATDVTRLQVTQDRQKLLLYVVIGLLVWLLIKLF